MPGDPVIAWLLERDQPSVRYLALRDLLGKRPEAPEVREARAQVPKVGWVATILAEREPGGWWVDEKSLYRPKYLATNWQLLVLADLGMTRAHPAVRRSCERWMARSPLRGGGVGGFSGGEGHLCYTGNMARALIQMGYAEDPRVRKAMEWLASSAHPKGGWSCFSNHGTGRNLDSWEALGAFAAYPRGMWSEGMRRTVERGCEYYLQRELHREGSRYAPWYRTHYPVHYYYDLLVGLDLLTSLGYAGDPRLRYALDWLRSKRRRDGRWNLDANHPDAGGGYGRWLREHPHRTRPLVLERQGRPSKMVTLRALRVLSRLA